MLFLLNAKRCKQKHKWNVQSLILKAATGGSALKKCHMVHQTLSQWAQEIPRSCTTICTQRSAGVQHVMVLQRQQEHKSQFAVLENKFMLRVEFANMPRRKMISLQLLRCAPPAVPRWGCGQELVCVYRLGGCDKKRFLNPKQG